MNRRETIKSLLAGLCFGWWKKKEEEKPFYAGACSTEIENTSAYRWSWSEAVEVPVDYRLIIDSLHPLRIKNHW